MQSVDSLTDAVDNLDKKEPESTPDDAAEDKDADKKEAHQQETPSNGARKSPQENKKAEQTEAPKGTETTQEAKAHKDTSQGGDTDESETAGKAAAGASQPTEGSKEESKAETVPTEKHSGQSENGADQEEAKPREKQSAEEKHSEEKRDAKEEAKPAGENAHNKPDKTEEAKKPESQAQPATSVKDISYEVLKKQSIDRKETMDCLCKQGQFWHWRIKDCVKQGAWAYECGFFPAEHHAMVCQDRLKCEVVQNTSITYGGHPGARPASCQHCQEGDGCLTGDKRHDDTCLKEYLLSNSACQTVRVTASVTTVLEATEEVNVDSSKAKATAQAEATGKGSAEGEACVTAPEVKLFMQLKEDQRMSAVLSAKVVSTGDELAFDKAYAKALAAARKAGLLDAQQAAKALAAAKAREHAGLDAKAKADEAAAWKAEAGEKKEAQEKAKADSLSEAEAKAAKEAAEAAAKAEAAAAAAAADAAKAEAGKAAEAAAAEAKAKQEAIADYLNGGSTQAPITSTAAPTTNAPRKIPAEDIAAKLP